MFQAIASSDFCTFKCATKRQSLSDQWHLSLGVSALQGFWFSAGGPWQGLVKAEGWYHGPLPLHILCPQLASWTGQQSQRKVKPQCQFMASISHHWVKAMKKKAYPGLGEYPWRESYERQPRWALLGLPGSTHMRGSHRLAWFWGGQS